VCLIDGEGKVAFVGHPASRHLEEDIETLLQGKKLHGVKHHEKQKEAEEEFFDLDLAKIDSEIANFT